ncbi:MAG: antibiotic biosynthesis monooxygenase [Polyangiaceae bacterium]
MTRLATTPNPPYFAVVFASVHASLSTEERAAYAATADRMVELARHRPGFLGLDSVRDTSGSGITVSYWVDEASIRAWRDDAEHTLARGAGRDRWYAAYTLRVARVERAYGWGE